MKKIYYADRISGIPGILFTLSIIAPTVAKTKDRMPYAFPFYGVTLNIKTRQATEWIINEDYKAVSLRVLQDVIDHGLDGLMQAKQTIQKEADDFQALAAKIIKVLGSISDEALIIQYEDFVRRYTESYALGAVTFLYEHQLSDLLANSVSARYPNATAIIGQLLTSDFTSFIIKADRLLQQIRQMQTPTTKQGLVEYYIDQFFYIKASYLDAPKMTLQDVLDETSANKNVPESAPPQAQDLSNVTLTAQEQAIIDILKLSAVIRDERKRINLIGSYCLFRFLEEASKRKKIPFDIVSRAFWYEYKDFFSNLDSLRSKLDQREYASVVQDDHGQTFYFDYEAIKPAGQVHQSSSEFKGTPASPGQATGLSIIVIGPADFKKMKPGNILVAEMTRPEFMPVMKKAAAIVTDEGGLTSHAAIVARELNIPCIVGTKIGTQALKDGDTVQVDAMKGLIKVLKRSNDPKK